MKYSNYSQHKTWEQPCLLSLTGRTLLVYVAVCSLHVFVCVWCQQAFYNTLNLPHTHTLCIDFMPHYMMCLTSLVKHREAEKRTLTKTPLLDVLNLCTVHDTLIHT